MKRKKEPTQEPKKSNGQGVLEVDPSGLQGPVRNENGLFFAAVDLMRFELAQSKVREAQQKVQLINGDLRQIQHNYEALVMRNQQQQAGAQNELRILERELTTLRDDIQRVYQLDIDKITYDDRSGQIYFPPEATPETPAS